MTKLTAVMRDTLDQARRGPLRRVHDDKPGKPPWPSPAVTLHALVRHGLLDRGTHRHRKGWPIDTWTITAAGREALEPAQKERADRPVFLARPTRTAGDYTTNIGHAIDDLEVIDPDLPAREWAEAAAQKHAGAADFKSRARRLAHNARAA